MGERVGGWQLTSHRYAEQWQARDAMAKLIRQYPNTRFAITNRRGAWRVAYQPKD